MYHTLSFVSILLKGLCAFQKADLILVNSKIYLSNILLQLFCASIVHHFEREVGNLLYELKGIQRDKNNTTENIQKLFSVATFLGRGLLLRGVGGGK